VLSGRADLFRLLGDEDRLRLLALCAEEELTVGELAHLLGESQPQVTKKTQPLREVGLLASRRDGTRTLLKTDVEPEAEPGRFIRTGGVDRNHAVISAALEEGRTLCSKDGSLAKVPRVIAAREELSRRLFETPAQDTPVPAADSALAWAGLLSPLLPKRALAVDIGTGEGSLLPLLSPLYERVIAVDRSAPRLARASANIASWGLPNVRLREGSVDDAAHIQEIGARADLVVMGRVLVHASRPQDVITSAARLLHPGGHLVIVDYLPHDDESLREQGHVWLGFEPNKLRMWLEAAKLQPLAVEPFSQPQLQLAVAKKPGEQHG
jgi:ArsR family transcriptional regulator